MNFHDFVFYEYKRLLINKALKLLFRKVNILNLRYLLRQAFVGLDHVI